MNQPIKSPYDLILEEVLKEFPNQNSKAAKVANKVVGILEEKNLCRLVAEAELAQTIQTTLGMKALAVVTVVSGTPTVEFIEATVANLAKFEEQLRKETKLLELKAFFEGLKGSEIDMNDLPESVKNLYILKA